MHTRMYTLYSYIFISPYIELYIQHITLSIFHGRCCYAYISLHIHRIPFVTHVHRIPFITQNTFHYQVHSIPFIIHIIDYLSLHTLYVEYISLRMLKSRVYFVIDIKYCIIWTLHYVYNIFRWLYNTSYYRYITFYYIYYTSLWILLFIVNILHFTVNLLHFIVNIIYIIFPSKYITFHYTVHLILNIEHFIVNTVQINIFIVKLIKNSTFHCKYSTNPIHSIINCKYYAIHH